MRDPLREPEDSLARLCDRVVVMLHLTSEPEKGWDHLSAQVLDEGVPLVRRKVATLGVRLHEHRGFACGQWHPDRIGISDELHEETCNVMSRIAKPCHFPVCQADVERVWRPASRLGKDIVPPHIPVEHHGVFCTGPTVRPQHSRSSSLILDGTL